MKKGMGYNSKRNPSRTCNILKILITKKKWLGGTTAKENTSRTPNILKILTTKNFGVQQQKKIQAVPLIF